MKGEKVKVLYLSYDGLTDPLGQSQILPYLTGLSAEFQITIVSFEKKDRFEKERKLVADICSQHHLTWVPLRYHKSPPVLSTLYDVWTMKKKAQYRHEANHFTIVHCRSYITSLVGLRMKRKYGLKFIFDMRGFWADERVEGGLWKLSNPVYRLVYGFFKRTEREFIKWADRIVVLTENARQEITSWKISDSIDVIPCCADLDYFDPARIDPNRKESLRTELGLRPGEFVLLYLGSLGTWYRLQDILDFFGELRKTIANARLLLVTPDQPDLSSFPYEKDTIIRNSPRELVPAYISLADASVLFIKPSYSKKGSSATKVAEILAMGIPMVVNRGWGDIDSYQLRLSGFVAIAGPADYARAIQVLLNPPSAEKIRSDAALLFSLTQGIEQYRAIYVQLTSSQSLSLP